MRRFNMVAGMLLLLVGLPFYWYFIDNSGPDAKPQPVYLAQLRYLAKAREPDRPERIRFEHIASYTRMSNRVAAGSGLRFVSLSTLAYLVEYPDAAPVLIGSGLTRSDAESLGQSPYIARAQARVVAALNRAAHVLPLSQSPDQLGGLRMVGRSAHGRVLAADLAAQMERDAQGVPYRIAPGIVIIPTPRLQAGSRLVYVRLANGREYLFAGELAQIRLNWSQLRLPARFRTDLGERKEDRGELRSWLLTLRTLQRQSPDLVIVSGNRLPEEGGLIHYFDASAYLAAR